MTAEARSSSKDRPRALFINRFYYPDHSATSQILTDVTAGLTALGWPVTVISSRMGYEDPSARYPAKDAFNGVSIVRVATSRFGRSNLVGRAIDYVSFYVTSFFAVLSEARRGDVVIVKTDPPLLSVPLGLAAKLKGARTVNWLQDIFPETAAALGLKVAASPVGRIAAALRNRSLVRADRTVVIGPGMKAKALAFGAPEGRLREIQNFCDDTAIQPVAPADNPLRAAWGFTPSDFVVGYSGNLGRAHDLSTLLAAADVLNPDPRFRFLFVGGGHLRSLLETEARARGLTNIVTRPYQPREQLALSLSVPDVHWVSLLPELEGLILPSKLYGIAAAGRPLLMIGDPEGDIGAWVRRHAFGAAFKIGDVDALVRTLINLQENPDLAAAVGQHARHFLDTTARREDIIRQWSELLAEFA